MTLLTESENRRKQLQDTFKATAIELAAEKLTVLRLGKEKESLTQEYRTQVDLLNVKHEITLKSRAGILPIEPVRLPRLDEEYLAERNDARAEVERLKSQLALSLVENANREAEVKRLTEQMATLETDARKKGIADTRASYDQQFDQGFPRLSNRIFSEYWQSALDLCGVPADS